MTNLAIWLEANRSLLIEAMTSTLSSNELLQTQVAEAVRAFYDDFVRASHSYSATPLYNTLMDWVEARSSSIGEDTISLMPVLAKLKQTTSNFIIHASTPDETIELLSACDKIFTDALVFVSQVETEVLTAQMHFRVQKAQDELSRLNKNKSDFIAIAAHELKTPLTVIEGYAGMVRQSVQAIGNSHLNACTQGIESGLVRLREIVDDIIDVSMIEMGMLDLAYQPVWMHHIMKALDRSLHHALAERQIEFTIDYDSIPTQATFADADRLHQVLRKVAMNAIKYTPDGGQITVSGRDRPGFIEILIQDTGIGIAPDNINQIFDAFSSSGDVSLHSSGKVKFKGSGPGLGLPIARGIIEEHGGSIWVESPGYNEQTLPGSTFHIMIPMREEPPDEPLSETNHQHQQP